jgi:hypothetical protein
MIPAAARTSHRFTRARQGVATAALALLAAACAQSAAAEQDTLANMPPGRQVWRVSDYGNVQLVPREAGAPLNQHPVKFQPEALRAQLEGVTAMIDGVSRQLFEPQEIDSDIGPLIEAFSRARPDQDVLLVSVARHEGGLFLAPSAVTSRLFYVNDRLNFIVRDTRYDFYDRVRGTNVNPTWVVGSRTKPGSAVLSRLGATSQRPDWLVFDMTQPAPTPVAQPAPAVVVGPAVTAAPAPAAAPAVAPAPASRTVAPVVVPVAPPAAAAPAATTPAATDAEHRLETLKRLYDKGLISSEEYQRKRKEIIDAL